MLFFERIREDCSDRNSAGNWAPAAYDFSKNGVDFRQFSERILSGRGPNVFKKNRREMIFLRIWSLR